MAPKQTKRAPTKSPGKSDATSGSRLLSLESVGSRLRNRGTIFFLLALILTSMWYGPYVFSSRVGIADTNKELYYFEYYRQSIRAGDLPFFFVAPPTSVAWYPAMKMSHAAFANPEVSSFSPNMLLMLFLPLVAFIKVNFALHFLVGVFGIYLLSKRLDLRLEFSLGLLLLVLLNPWFLQHIAIGYFPWINVAFYPLMAALLIGREKGKYDLCYAALINALILYQGGLHPFVWFNGSALLVVLLHSGRYRTVRPLGRILAFYLVTAFAGLPKLLMTASIWGGMKQPIHPTYNSFEGLWAILTDCTKDAFAHPAGFYNVPWYDGSLYMGIFFLVLVALSIVVGVFREKWALACNALLIPAIIMVIISWGTNWKATTTAFESATESILGTPIYALRAEKYPWRFLFPGVVLISSFAMIQFSRFVSAIKSREVRILASCTVCILLALIGNDLWARNSYFLKVATEESSTWVKTWDIKNNMSQPPVVDMNRNLIPVRWPDGSISPDRIEIPSQWFAKDGAVILPWLKSKDVPLFRTENCEVDNITIAEHPDSVVIGSPDAWLAPDRQVAVLKIKDRTKNVLLTYDKSNFFLYLITGILGVVASFVIANIAGRAKHSGKTPSTVPI